MSASKVKQGKAKGANSAGNGAKAAGAAEANARPQTPPTVAHMLGEMTWLLTQSPLHNQFTLKDLEWLVMPALMHQHYYVFRDGDKPVGLALWAHMSEEAEKKLEKPLIEPENRLTPDEWKSGTRTWLIDLIAPFATADNNQVNLMIADLIAGPLSGREWKLHKTDPNTGKREVVTITADTAEKLKAVVEKAVKDAGGAS